MHFFFIDLHLKRDTQVVGVAGVSHVNLATMNAIKFQCTYSGLVHSYVDKSCLVCLTRGMGFGFLFWEGSSDYPTDSGIEGVMTRADYTLYAKFGD